MFGLPVGVLTHPQNKSDSMGNSVGRTISEAVSDLGNPNIKVQESAVETLKELAYPGITDNMKLIGECPGAVQGLVELLSSSSGDIQEKAAGALSRLASDSRNKQVIGECPGAMQGLVGLLSSSSGDIQEKAAGALFMLAFNSPANMQLIGECPGAVQGLVELLSGSNCYVQCAAANVLYYLAKRSPANRQLIGECPGAVQGLVGLLSSTNAGVRDRAVLALHSLFNDCLSNQQLILSCPEALPALQLCCDDANMYARPTAERLMNLLNQCIQCGESRVQLDTGKYTVAGYRYSVGVYSQGCGLIH